MDLVKIVLDVIVRQDGVICVKLDVIGKKFNCCVMLEVVSYGINEEIGEQRSYDTTYPGLPHWILDNMVMSNWS